MRKPLSLIFCLGLIFAGVTSGGPPGFKVDAAQKSRSRKPRVRAKRKPSEPSPAEIAARRDAVQKLMLNGEYQHDGAGELLYIGDIGSVPALLRVLKDNPPTKTADGRLMYICTAAHAVAALVKITGHRGGGTYEEWSAWWERYQKEHPVK